jgi:hypothetical protein
MSRLLMVLLLAGVARADEPSFESLGQAPVVAGDRVRARERALDEALRQAVEQAAATVLDPAELVARASDLKLRIYPRARSYVANYRVLDEGDAPGGLYQVHLSAQVATGRLGRDLGGAAARPPAASVKKRAVLCVAAAGDAASAPDGALRALLGARGVEALSPGAVCSDEAAVAAARAGGAQAALVGALELAPEGAIRGTERVAAHAHARLRLLELDGRSAAESSAERYAYEATPARAAEAAAAASLGEAAEALAPAIARRWSGEAPTGGVRVRLARLQRWADYATVTRALGAVPGVSAVEPRRFAHGEAELLVRTASTAAQLVPALARQLPADGRVTARAEGELGLVVDIAPPAE